MWDIFDQWLVLLALGWAGFIIYKNLSKKSYFSCNSPCNKNNKKIFNNNSPVMIRRKIKY